MAIQWCRQSYRRRKRVDILMTHNLRFNIAWDAMMATVTLFWDTNIAVMTKVVIDLFGATGVSFYPFDF